ncbi:MAG: histidine--tRNA ligase [Myxococcota bacterium]
MEKLRAVRGMNDILVDETPRWRRIEERFRALAARYGYGEVRFPLLEPTALFVRSIGETTDIVEKEMYTFVDKGEHSLTLRPEGTASAARAFIEHSAHAKQPVHKWIYLGPMFRRERPAKGRFRQFHQLGAELFGDPGPHCDAEMIDMVVAFLDDIGVRDIQVLVNSLGGPETRPRYRGALLAYLRPHAERLCPDCRRRMETNPLRVLDCKVEADAEVARGAPRILDFLGEDDQSHFEDLTATLEALGTPHEVDPTLVRGLDYYTRTLFEVRGRGGNLGAQNALCGGGRYDGLVESLGGPSTPAIGFAMGIERLLLTLPPEADQAPLDAFVAVASPELRVEATRLCRDLRRDGLRVDADLRGQSLKSQLRRADRSGARAALVLGGDEVARGTVQLKDLRGPTREDVARDELAERIRALAAPGPSGDG